MPTAASQARSITNGRGQTKDDGSTHTWLKLSGVSDQINFKGMFSFCAAEEIKGLHLWEEMGETRRTVVISTRG